MKHYRQRAGFVNLSEPTYGSMIKAYGQAADVQRVQELWAEMLEKGEAHLHHLGLLDRGLGREP